MANTAKLRGCRGLELVHLVRYLPLFQVLRDQLTVLERLGLDILSLFIIEIFPCPFHRLSVHIMPVAPRCLPLLLAFLNYFPLLCDFNVQNLPAQHQLLLIRTFLNFLQLFPGFLHLFQIPYPRHIKYLTCVYDPALLVPQGVQIVDSVGVLLLISTTWQPLYRWLVLVVNALSQSRAP